MEEGGWDTCFRFCFFIPLSAGEKGGRGQFLLFNYISIWSWEMVRWWYLRDPSVEKCSEDVTWVALIALRHYRFCLLQDWENFSKVCWFTKFTLVHPFSVLLSLSCLFTQLWGSTCLVSRGEQHFCGTDNYSGSKPELGSQHGLGEVAGMPRWEWGQIGEQAWLGPMVNGLREHVAVQESIV